MRDSVEHGGMIWPEAIQPSGAMSRNEAGMVEENYAFEDLNEKLRGPVDLMSAMLCPAKPCHLGIGKLTDRCPQLGRNFGNLEAAPESKIEATAAAQSNTCPVSVKLRGSTHWAQYKQDQDLGDLATATSRDLPQSDAGKL